VGIGLKEEMNAGVTWVIEAICFGLIPSESAIEVSTRMPTVHPLVEQIEELFLPELQQLASDLQQRHPNLKFNVWHSRVGSHTDYQGYDFGVESLFPNVAQNGTDNIALTIGVCHLTSTPKLMADVVWGHPCGNCEASFRDDLRSIADWPVAEQSVIEELKAYFPTLARAFRLAIASVALPDKR
jgi:hypothetical protein